MAAWFAFTTGELWLLAAIKKAKVKRKDEGNENQLETEIEATVSFGALIGVVSAILVAFKVPNMTVERLLSVLPASAR